MGKAGGASARRAQRNRRGCYSIACCLSRSPWTAASWEVLEDDVVLVGREVGHAVPAVEVQFTPAWRGELDPVGPFLLTPTPNQPAKR